VFVGSCVAMCGPWHPSGGGGGDALGILVWMRVSWMRVSWMRGVLESGCLGIRVSWNQGVLESGCLGIRGVIDVAIKFGGEHCE